MSSRLGTQPTASKWEDTPGSATILQGIRGHRTYADDHHKYEQLSMDSKPGILRQDFF